MPIQKFKYGQEITSAKLNEIVTFVNNLEGYLNNAQYWTDNIDSKISGFQNQLTSILNQVKDLLKTSDSFDTLLSSYLNLKSLYESLVAENVENLLEQLLSPSNLSVDANGNVIINGIETDIQVTTIVGPVGPSGANGLNGTNGLNGSTILTGTTTPSNELGLNNDLYLNLTSFVLSRKESGVWVIKGNLIGPRGLMGNAGVATYIEFRYRTNLSDSPTPQPSASTKFLEFRTYLSSDTNEQRQSKPWIVLKIRGDNWYPVITAGENNQTLLSWSTEEPSQINPVNIRGPQGTQGIKGDKGDSGNNFILSGQKDSTEDLPSTGSEGEAWFVGTELPYNVYIWDTGLSVPDWVNVGPLQGPTGESGADGETGPQGPTGPQGVRGSKTFIVEEDSLFPTATPWNSTALIVGDIFLSEESGLMKQITTLSPFTLEEVYKLPYENQLVFRPKVTEAVSKGNVLQFAGVQGGHKLAKKAVPSEINANPEYIMGVAKTSVTANSFVEVVNFGQIDGITGFTEGDILYFDSTNLTNGVLTAVKPSTDSAAKIVVAAYVGGAQNILQVRVGTAHLYTDLMGIQTVLNTKANKIDPIFSGTVTFSSGTVGNGFTLNTPALTGLPTAPTQSPGDNSTRIASTAFVQAGLALKANLAGPALTGTPTAPTASAGTNTTQIATTAFVKTAVDNLINSAPGALDTLDELAAALGDDANYAATVTTALAGKAPTVHSHAITDVTGLQTALDGKASTTHTHLISVFNTSPTAISNTSPFTTLTLSENIQAGNRLLIRWGSNTDVKFYSELYLMTTSGSDHFNVIEKRLDAIPSNDTTALLSLNMGNYLTTGSYTGNQLTFRNGLFQSPSGTQTTQTMYVQAIYKVVL